MQGKRSRHQKENHIGHCLSGGAFALFCFLKWLERRMQVPIFISIRGQTRSSRLYRVGLVFRMKNNTNNKQLQTTLYIKLFLHIYYISSSH